MSHLPELKPLTSTDEIREFINEAVAKYNREIEKMYEIKETLEMNGEDTGSIVRHAATLKDCRNVLCRLEHRIRGEYTELEKSVAEAPRAFANRSCK